MANMGQTMGEYTMDAIDKAKMLDEPINNEIIMYMLKKHFPFEVACKVKVNLKDPAQFVQLLDAIEAMRKSNYKVKRDSTYAKMARYRKLGTNKATYTQMIESPLTGKQNHAIRSHQSVQQ